MSCFIVEKETVAKIADYIEAIYNCGYEYAGFELPRTLRKYIEKNCVVQRDMADAELIYNELYQLNYATYNGRYKEEEVVCYPEYKACSITEPIEWGESHWIVKPWHYQMLKHIDCLIYQCDESANKNNELLGGLRLFAIDLALFVVRNTQEYCDAQWR